MTFLPSSVYPGEQLYSILASVLIDSSDTLLWPLSGVPRSEHLLYAVQLGGRESHWAVSRQVIVLLPCSVKPDWQLKSIIVPGLILLSDTLLWPLSGVPGSEHLLYAVQLGGRESHWAVSRHVIVLLPCSVKPGRQVKYITVPGLMLMSDTLLSEFCGTPGSLHTA